MYRISYPKTVVLTCEHCETIHENVPVQCDEDGPYAEIETQPCHADGCHKKLCSRCPQFVCDGCGLTHCEEHRVRLGNLSICPVCMAVTEEEAAQMAAETMEAA